MKAKKYPKADLNNYRMIFFQVGLIISLGITYIGIQWSSDSSAVLGEQELNINMIDTETPPVTEMKMQELPPPPPPVVPEIIEVIEDELEVEETIMESTETSLDEAMTKVIKVEAIKEEKMEESIEEVPFVLIANVPVYPGCEVYEDNASRKQCLSNKIQEIVKDNFNTNLGADLGLKGINRVFVVFTIDHMGKVTNIRTRGPHEDLEKEAMRVIQLISDMIPGYQRNKPVKVTYNLPITFEVRPGS
ncbi:energy transducer TonB [Gramella sp. GC03-9]|uniref:Energy transducer TonB n=1 Tax=Christiangramia oceanisediminis TaxID=2920386 RepID=A0A9X2KVU5_9FLAO|nr:energy transducer TonB [Gramella oceanisediminis]MCP9198808.1 energy transducer TonB [Gramella oceanisediminis]